MNRDASALLPTIGTDEVKYELLGRFATGGMAELYLARPMDERANGQVVVLKRILPHLAEDPEFVRMFRDEAHLAATLDHPNVVRVFDVGRHDLDHFFTMEYVHGENLRTIVRALEKRKEDTVPLQHVLTIMIAVTAALHYAHERTNGQGKPLCIVHRDVSPTNVLVGYNGAVKILDFGIAKAAAGTHVTQAGMLKGKAAYMSPEQCRADPVDRRSDVFAIGILLYELSTLRRLFRGDNEIAIMHQVITGAVPPPSSVSEHYPSELERIVLKALHLDPTQRYQTARELQEDLQRFALSCRIVPSRTALRQYIVELFGERPLPWVTEGPASTGSTATGPATDPSIPRAVPRVATEMVVDLRFGRGTPRPRVREPSRGRPKPPQPPPSSRRRSPTPTETTRASPIRPRSTRTALPRPAPAPPLPVAPSPPPPSPRNLPYGDDLYAEVATEAFVPQRLEDRPDIQRSTSTPIPARPMGYPPAQPSWPPSPFAPQAQPGFPPHMAGLPPHHGPGTVLGPIRVPPIPPRPIDAWEDDDLSEFEPERSPWLAVTLVLVVAGLLGILLYRGIPFVLGP